MITQAQVDAARKTWDAETNKIHVLADLVKEVSAKCEAAYYGYRRLRDEYSNQESGEEAARPEAEE